MLRSGDYASFLRALASRFKLGLASLQGYEPLLAESWACSMSILVEAGLLGIKTALVTNGTRLASCLDDLVALDITGITVSLDSADPVLHDASRGTVGAYAATLSGLRQALASPLSGRILVASVLQPEKLHYLEGVPPLLSQLGLRKWIVTPMYKIARSGFGGPTGQPDQIVQNLVRLQAIASHYGVKMLVDDELDALVNRAGELVSETELQLRRLSRLEQVMRLSPDGAFSIGGDILRSVGPNTARWHPERGSAAMFLDRPARHPVAVN